MFLCCVSVTAPLDTVGVWTERGRREQEPGLHLVQHLKTVTDQVRLLVQAACWSHHMLTK